VHKVLARTGQTVQDQARYGGYRVHRQGTGYIAQVVREFQALCEHDRSGTRMMTPSPGRDTTPTLPTLPAAVSHPPEPLALQPHPLLVPMIVHAQPAAATAGGTVEHPGTVRWLTLSLVAKVKPATNMWSPVRGGVGRRRVVAYVPPRAPPPPYPPPPP
jgi:hypothetical protein